MKKILPLAIALGVLVSPMPASAQAYASNQPEVSIKLVNFLGSKSEITIRTSGIYSATGSLALEPSTDYKVRVESGVLNLYKGTQKVKNLGTTFEIAPDVYDQNHIISINGRKYLGSISLTIESGKYVRPINHVLLEDYLKGVVSYEVSDSWGNYGGMEALKAQAIAARTFVLRYGDQTITDTQSHQVYGGMVEKSNVDKAVSDTSGEVAKSNGSLISAYYSASNGGKVLSTMNSWGSKNEPYLKLKDDPYDIRSNNSNVSWSVELNKKQIDLAGKDLKNPASWWDSVKESSDATLISNMKSYLEKYYINSKYEIKILSIPSVSFTTTFTNDQRIDGTVEFEYILKDTSITNPSQNPYVMENGEIKKHKITVKERAYNIRTMMGSTIMKSPYVKEVQNQSTSFVIKGGGWGHGIGMSQYGAYQMSKEGHSYKEILDFYYPSVQINDIVAPFVSNEKVFIGRDNSVDFSFNVDEDSTLTLKVIKNDTKTETIIVNNKLVKKGVQTETWDAKNFAAGEYTYVITVNDGENTTQEQYSFTLPQLEVLENVETMITLTENTKMYTTPDINQTSAGGLAPQTVFATQKLGKYYKIVTYAGDRWIYPSNPEFPEIQKVSEKLSTNKRLELYRYPTTLYKVGTTMAPQQQLSVIAKYGNFYKIQSWLGNVWIQYDAPVTFNEKINLTEKTVLLNTPDTSTAPVSSVSPQTVQATQKAGEYYLINTWLGSKWIKPNNEIVGEISSANEKLYVAEKKFLHDLPIASTVTNSGISPQTVQVVAKWGNWVKIKTWVGEKWIKL